MQRLRASLVLTIMLTTAVPAAVGTHGQETASGDPLAFEHRTGNEWWVEVVVSGTASLATVEAQDEDGPWVELSERSWGAWAASFHIEPGHEVRFRATLDDGSQVTSCWFTHPDGDERCREAGSSSGDDFEALFDPVPGNEWWVETYVDAREPLALVEARDDGGPWVDLQHRDWGAWAESFHVADGSVVEFRATSTDADTNVSQPYRWPNATPTNRTAPANFTATFDPVEGNEWWVETYVDANRELAGVQARDDGGPWVDLQHRDWGAWAESFHVADGSVVEFRAEGPNGTTIDSQGYLWPGAEPAEES